jgi:hypothetical protein
MIAYDLWLKNNADGKLQLTRCTRHEHKAYRHVYKVLCAGLRWHELCDATVYKTYYIQLSVGYSGSVLVPTEGPKSRSS